MPKAPLPHCACIRDEYGFVWTGDCVRHGNAGKEKGNPFVRGAGLKPVSDTRKAEKERWALIKDAMLIAQQRTQGFVSCMVCGKRPPPHFTLDLDHIKPSGKGVAWVADNAVLSCRSLDGTRGCHVEKHGRLGWSHSSDRANASQGQSAPPLPKEAS